MKLPAACKHLIFAALMVITTREVLGAAVPAVEPGGDTVLLWPKGTPGAEHVTVKETLSERAPDGPLRDRIAEHVTRPLLTLFHARGNPNGVTLLIVPGGAYVRVVIDKEGFESAEWFAQRGFDCAVLRYRMPADGWAAGPDAPVHDAMRALRLLRSRPGATPAAARRFGVIGFSAGGHLTARLITEPALAYPPQDEADALSARPDFAVLMYPVIAMNGQATARRRCRSWRARSLLPEPARRRAHAAHAAGTCGRRWFGARRELAADVRRVTRRRGAQRAACVRPRRARVRNARRGWHRCSSVAAAGRNLGAVQCETVVPLSADGTC